MNVIKITDFLRADAVLDDLSGRTPREVLAELCQVHAGVVNPRLALKGMLEREKLGSTAIGEGLAIPHARVPGLRMIVASFGRSKAGVEFGAPDGKRSHSFFALLTPEIRASSDGLDAHTYANLLARICSIFERPGFRRGVSRAPHSRAIFRLLVDEDRMCRRGERGH